MKEIIIDGVNVAGCDAYKDKHCKDKTSIIFCDTNLCSNYPYCYYKQLKRLEQENAELKAENERLKEEIKTRDNLIDHFRDEALYWATIASEYQKDKTKLEQTLQEIKKLCERQDLNQGMRCFEILKVIKKAEVWE